MRKSIFVLMGLGLAGAIALGAMLRHVLATQQVRLSEPPAYAPYATAVQDALRGRLVGLPRVHRRAGVDGPELHVELRATAGQRAANIAAEAGAALWRAADAAGATVILVAAEVAVAGGETLRCEVPRLAVVLPRKSTAVPPSAPQSR